MCTRSRGMVTKYHTHAYMERGAMELLSMIRLLIAGVHDN